MKQTTAPNRMGSHRALSSVMTISLILVSKFLFSDATHSAAVCRVQQPLAGPVHAPPHCLPCQRPPAALLLWIVIAASGAHAQDAAQVQRELIDAQIAQFAGEADPRGRVYFLGFAGFGEERVFAEEIKLAAQRVGERYGSSMRSVLLLNDRRDLSTYPLASPSSLRYSLKAIAQRHEP